MCNLSQNVITYRNAENVETYMRERAKQRNQAMKRQMSQFLLRTQGSSGSIGAKSPRHHKKRRENKVG